MLDIFIKILPLFSLVAFGFLCKNKKIISVSYLKYITRFVMYISLPAVLLVKLSLADFNTLIDFKFLTAYLCSLFVIMLISIIIAYKTFSKDVKNSIMLGLGSVYGNIGFLAIPVLSTTIGEWVSVPLALMLTLDLLVLLPIATFFLQINNNSGSRLTPIKVLTRSLLNPLILSIVLGLLLSTLEVSLPSNILVVLEYLGKAAGPCAMFIVGTSLYGRKINHNPVSAVYMSTFKLLIMPFAVYFLMTLLSVNPDWVIAATLGAAMPCAAVLGVIAEDHQAMPQQASTAVLITTVLSVLTIPLLIHVFS